ncbi:hypothetical protein [Providencia sneebia]|uniref:Type III secretion system EscV protein n=1 Tax=Providencia sneebia DSM 19967 TaxID=1141660 RepID=K8WHR2_9GAMM|nr:type III secretion system EscV protein [Providencia sneebia DSM 19967]
MFKQLSMLSGWLKISSVLIVLIFPAIILAPLPGIVIDIFVLFSLLCQQ